MAKKKSRATKLADAQRAAERAAAIRREQLSKERRRRTVWVSVAVLAVLALVVGVVAGVQAFRDTTGETATPPAGAVDTFALPMGEPGAPVTVEVYEDFLCPFCGQFEAQSRDVLKEYAESGDAQVQYKVISILDGASSTDYSTRAANAMAVVLDEAGPDVAVAFHDLLFENQPEEGSAGLSDDELVDLAVEAGGSEATVREPIESLSFEQWVKNATDESSKDGIAGTPSILVDGEKVEGGTIAEVAATMEDVIDAALAE